ncbi:MAG: thioesterase family protein [Longicatena sp.]
MKDIQIHATYNQEITVSKELLASSVGSGIVDVYATPMMIALMENTATTCLNQFLEQGETSVGVMMNTTHDAPTPLGMKVFVSAEIVGVDRKKVSFKIIAKDEKDTIGTALHDRFIINKEKFEAKANSKLD